MSEESLLQDIMDGWGAQQQENETAHLLDLLVPHDVQRFRSLNPAPPDEVCVYLIGPATQPPHIIKVGISSDCERRLRALQSGSPLKLEVLRYIRFQDRDLARKIEQQFHHSMRHLRSHGEWFNISVGDALAELAEIAQRASLEE